MHEKSNERRLLMENNVTVVRVTTEKGKKFFERLSEVKHERLRDLESYANNYIWGNRRNENK